MAIPTSRNQAAFQTHWDWGALRDDKPLYFGNDFDANIQWDTGSSALVITGAVDITGAFSPTGTVTIAGDLNISGGDISLSDTAKIEFGNTSDLVYMTSSNDASGVSDSIIVWGIPTSDTGVAGALYTTDGSDLHIRPYA